MFGNHNKRGRYHGRRCDIKNNTGLAYPPTALSPSMLEAIIHPPAVAEVQ